jgi:hypothetical protein
MPTSSSHNSKQDKVITSSDKKIDKSVPLHTATNSSSTLSPAKPITNNPYPSDFQIDPKALNALTLDAEKIPMGITDKSIIMRLLKYFNSKFPLTTAELRKIFKIALHLYRTQNNIALEKIALLNPEERIEVFTQLKCLVIAQFELLLIHKTPKVMQYLNQTILSYFEKYSIGLS